MQQWLRKSNRVFRDRGADRSSPSSPEDELRHPIDFVLLQNRPLTADADPAALADDVTARKTPRCMRRDAQEERPA
jgi:hypothetical protein